MASYFASLYSYGASLLGYGAETTNPQPTNPQPEPANTGAPMSDESRQLELTRRYLAVQEQHKSDLLPGIADDIWSLIASPSSPMPALFYPTGSANAAVAQAMADPAAYLAAIPSANAFVKKLYNQANVRDSRTRTLVPPNPVPVHNKTPLQRLAPKMVPKAFRGTRQPLPPPSATVLPSTVTMVMKKFEPSLAAKNASFNMEQKQFVGKYRPDLPYGAVDEQDNSALIAELKARMKARFFNQLRSEVLETDYLARREAITEMLGLPRVGTPASAITPDKVVWIRSQPLYNLLLIIERNWLLILGAYIELAALIAATEQSPFHGMLTLEWVRSFGVCKGVTKKLEQVFMRQEFSWEAVHCELGV